MEDDDVWPGSPPTGANQNPNATSGYPCSLLTVAQAKAFSSQTQGPAPRDYAGAFNVQVD